MPSIRNYVDFYFNAIHTESSLIELIKILKYHPPPLHHIYVVDGDKVPIGVIDLFNLTSPFRDFTGFLRNPRSVNVKDLMRELHADEKLKMSTRLKKAAKIIYEGELPGAPVVKRGPKQVFIGDINRFGLLRAYQYIAPEDETVAELMRDPINVFSRHDSVSEILAWLRLQPPYQRFAIVVEEEHSYNSSPLGVISLDNLISCTASLGSRDKLFLIAEDVMAKTAIVNPNESSKRVASLMHLYKTHIVPVVDQDNSLVGIVTSDDILVRIFKSA